MTTKATPKATPAKATPAKATPKAATPAPVAPVPDPEPLPDLIPLDEFVQEAVSETDAYLSNTAVFSAALDKHAEAAVDWAPHDAAAQLALAAGAASVMAAREQVILPSGIPDWAGNSSTYAKTFNVRFTRALSDAGVAPERVEAWRESLRQFMSRTRYAETFIAQHVVRTVPNIGNEPVGKKDKDGNAVKTVASVVKAATKETAIPTPVKREMRKHYEAQVSASNNRLAGFKTVPDKFGVKPPSGSSGGSAGNVGQATPSKKWESLGEEANRLAALAAVNALRELTTKLSDALLGAPGQKPSQLVAKDGEIPKRDEVTEAWRNLATLATMTADGIEPMDGFTKDALATYRYVPEK